jgi:hypothetical protein
MKNKDTKNSAAQSRPIKVLLHMVRAGEDWAGKATDFNHSREYKFSNLDDLIAWLRAQDKK